MIETRRKSMKNEDDFDIKKIISRFLYYWKLYFLCICVFIILGFLFLRYSTPLYKTNAQILVQDEQSGSPSSSSFLAGSSLQDFNSLFGIKNNVYNELGILQTQDLLYKVIDDLKLNINYYRKGNVRSVELYSKTPFRVKFIPRTDSLKSTAFNIRFLKNENGYKYKISNGDMNIDRTASFGDTIQTAIGTISVIATGSPFEDADYFFSLRPADEVIMDIINNLTVSITNDETTIIGLTYNSNIPKKAEDILKTLITEYLQRNLIEKNKISDSSLVFINDRIKIVSAELNAIEGNIQNFKQRNKIADISEQAKALISNSSVYYNKLNEVEVQLNVIKSMLTLVKNDANNIRPIPTTLNNDPTFLTLVEKHNALLLEKDRLLLTTTDQNPYVKNLDDQILNVRHDIIKSLETQENAYQISKQRIIAENSVLDNTVYNVPAQERTFIGLSREQSVKQALYLYLLQKKEETSITKASNIPGASVIETPKSEYQPYFPMPSLVMAISFLLGLIIPTGIVILKYMLSNRIISREDITNHTDCNILAEIGHSEEEGLLLNEGARSVLAEQFRMFRTNMDFLTGQQKCPTILITSSMTGEGKSFIAANLAQVYAYSGKKVLLMEMDLRKPKLSTMLDMPNNIGFSNFIISGKSVKDFIRPLKHNPNIYLMSSGPIPPNPAELLMSASVSNMFEELSTMFDTIIIDSPPIGAVTDSQILAKHTHVNLYILRQKYTFKSSLEIINDILDNKKFSNLYLVVNDVQKGPSYRYGYSYGYGYGYGYSEPQKNKRWIFKKKLSR